MPRRPEITKWQMEVLIRAAELESRRPEMGVATLSDVAASLRVSRQQVLGALERLESRVGQSLVEELDDGVHVRRGDLIRTARSIVDGFQQFEREAREGFGHWWIRLDGFWANLGTFLADAARDLERDHPETYVELSPQFGQSRDAAGAGLARRVERGEVDLAIAPSESKVGRGIEVANTHIAVVLAAIAEDHPLRTDDASEPLEVRQLVDEGYPLLVSPRGHTTRELLEACVQTGEFLNVEVTGTEPSALVVMRGGRRVPIVASDSIFPPHVAGTADNPWAIPSHWRALSHQGRLLHTRYAAFHRTFVPKEDRGSYGSTRFVPEVMGGWLAELAARCQQHAADRLSPRTAVWNHLLQSQR